MSPAWQADSLLLSHLGRPYSWLFGDKITIKYVFLRLYQGIVSVQFRSVAQSCPTLCDLMTAACQASLSIINSQSLLKLMSIELVIPSSHLIPLSSPSPPAPNPSQHQGFFPMSPFFVSGGQNIVYVLQRIVNIIQNPALYAYDEVIFSKCDLLNHIYLMWFTWFLLNRNMYCLHITRYSLHITKYSIVCLWLHDF